MNSDTKHEAQGLEVVAWRIGFPNNDGYKLYEHPQPWAQQMYGVPPAIVYDVQELCRLSDAMAVIDQLRAELAALKSAPVVLPERLTSSDYPYATGWNDCISTVVHLNKSKTNEQ